MKGIEKETEGMEATDIPVVGKIYHVFDDGKITLPRHYLVNYPPPKGGELRASTQRTCLAQDRTR